VPVIGGTQIRTAAVHALGIVAGATRADFAMSASAEDTFRQVTFTAAAGPSGFQDPADVLLGYLRQPFADLRTGGYRCAAPFSCLPSCFHHNAFLSARSESQRLTPGFSDLRWIHGFHKYLRVEQRLVWGGQASEGACAEDVGRCGDLPQHTPARAAGESGQRDHRAGVALCCRAGAIPVPSE
jgi:hypothetical protein